jgi:Uma2 family endonuclease
MYAMSGASLQHNEIVMNLAGELRPTLKRRGCKAYSNDLRVKLPAGDSYAYPDLVVICDKARLEDEKGDTLLTPQVIIEVLSPSTEAHDRGAKFQHYQQVESLREYVLVSQSQPLVELFERQPNGQWLFTSFAGLDETARFPSIDCAVRLAEIYDGVEFNTPASPERR